MAKLPKATVVLVQVGFWWSEPAVTRVLVWSFGFFVVVGWWWEGAFGGGRVHWQPVATVKVVVSLSDCWKQVGFVSYCYY